MKFVKFVETLSNVLSYIALALVAVIGLFLTADVFMRFAFNNPIVGAIEISQMLMSGLVLVFPRCALEARHLKITFVLEYLPKKFQSFANIFVLFLSLFVSVMLAWQSASTAVYLKLVKRTYSLIRVPYYPFYWIMTAGYIVLSLAIIALLLSRKDEVNSIES
ncbi:MAG: TRAP transporter small permease [Firmicutes bacterium]|nr:TRAP transporter small permease [Bacillota bacterium]